MCIDLRMRVSDARVYTFKSRMAALGYLTSRFRSEPLSSDAWRHTRNFVLEPREWPGEQSEFLDYVEEHINIRDSTDLAGGLTRFMHITGRPGTGKTEVIIHAAYRAAANGCRVLILCPTVALVHAYKKRLPQTDQIVVETLA